MQKRIIAINSNTYHGFTLDQALEGIKAAGFHSIELTATKGWTEHVFPNMSFEELWRIKDKLQDYEIDPISMSGHCNLMDQERIADFIANMRLANFFGCTYITSSVGEAHIKDKAHASNQEVAEHIRKLLPHIEKYDLVLGLENHGEHSTCAIIEEIVDAVGSERVKINFDTANGILYAGKEPVEDMRSCAAKIGHLHLKDKAGADNEWNFPALGDGHVDFPAIFSLLEGNDAPASIEIEFTSKGPGSLAEVHEAVRKSGEYLRRIGAL